MSFAEDEIDLDPDTYLDEDIDEELIESDYAANKNVDDYDNDDNLNDYVDDIDPEDFPDVDDNDDTYEDYDETENDDDNEDEEYNSSNINFNENDLDNDSKFQYIVKTNERITSNILTIYEFVELISIRATQISNGSYIITDITGLSDPMEMAKKEILDNKTPLYIKRYIGLDRYELLDVNLMAKPKI